MKSRMGIAFKDACSWVIGGLIRYTVSERFERVSSIFKDFTSKKAYYSFTSSSHFVFCVYNLCSVSENNSSLSYLDILR